MGENPRIEGSLVEARQSHLVTVTKRVESVFRPGNALLVPTKRPKATAGN